MIYNLNVPIVDNKVRNYYDSLEIQTVIFFIFIFLQVFTNFLHLEDVFVKLLSQWFSRRIT